MAILGGFEGIHGRVLPCELPGWHIYCLGCHKSCNCAPKFVAVWPCSRSFFFLQEPHNAEGLDWYFPEWLNLLCEWVVEWAHQRSRAGDQERHVLSFKKFFIITFTSSVTFQLFFLLSDFLHLLLVDSHDCFASIMFFLSKKNSNHRIHKHCSLQAPFFLTSFVFADSDGWFTSIMFSFKKLFSSHSRALLLSFTFLFQRHLRFLVNGSWCHDKLSAPYFVPCCTENISIIEIDHSLHCYHWMHFTKRLWEAVPTTTRHNYYCSFTKPGQSFFQKELRQFHFIWYGHATTKKVSHKVDETECRWVKYAPSEGNSDGASGMLASAVVRLRCLRLPLWASRNRTFPVSLQPRGLCDRR